MKHVSKWSKFKVEVDLCPYVSILYHWNSLATYGTTRIPLPQPFGGMQLWYIFDNLYKKTLLDKNKLKHKSTCWSKGIKGLPKWLLLEFLNEQGETFRENMVKVRFKSFVQKERLPMKQSSLKITMQYLKWIGYVN